MSTLKAAVNDYNFPSFALQGLAAHNKYRTLHGVPELTLDKQICAVAQEWADNCAKQKFMKFRKDIRDNIYGENIYSSNDNSLDVMEVAVKSWYDEIEKYNFDLEKPQKKCLQFTQLIWKNTTDLGLGIARSARGKVFVVADYYPKGNIPGEFLENVPKPVSLKTENIHILDYIGCL